MATVRDQPQLSSIIWMKNLGWVMSIGKVYIVQATIMCIVWDPYYGWSKEGKKRAIVGQKDRDWGSSGDCFAVTENQNRDLGAVDVFPSGRNWSSVCSVDTRARLPISPIYPLFSFHPPPTTTVGWSMTIAGFIRISRAGWSPGKKFSGAHAVGGASKVQSSSWEKKQILSMT